MNNFGRVFRVSILGESHSNGVGILIDGCPAGLELSEQDFLEDLTRRQGGNQVGTTPRKEADVPSFRSGLFNSKTTAAPLLIWFDNANTQSKDYDEVKDKPRPGHADLTGRLKYGGFNDYRGGGHFSGRLTAALVAAGVVAKKLMPTLEIRAEVIEVNGSKNIDEEIVKALEAGDSVGGLVECVCKGIPLGLGEPFFDSLESLIAHAAFAIPATKAIEFGSGFRSTKMYGSEFNDDIDDAAGKTITNHAGGINGGISNGNDLVFRIATKPTSSIKKEKNTVDLKTGEKTTLSVKGRHDACIALRVPPVLEAIAAIVLCDCMLLEQKIARVL
jgi:chorismate synthase